MNIGIVSPFNPHFMQDYLEGKSIPSLHNSAMAVNTLVKALVDKGNYVKVFTTCPNIKSTRILSGRNLTVFLVPSCLLYFKPSFSHSFLLDSYYLPKRLSRVIKKELSTLDVIHAHWTYDFALACIPFISQVPIYVTVRDWCPYIMSMQKGIMNQIAWGIKYKMFKKIMMCTEIQLIANSWYTYKKIMSAYPNRSVEVIFNPIDERYILKEKKKEIKNQFITIAQIVDDPRKNIETLLKAFKMYRGKLNSAHLHVIGHINKNGNTYLSWENSELLEGVTMYGNIDHEKMMEMIDDMSCLVHPSLEETFGNILLEGMARCLPCIGGRDSGAVPFVLGQGEYGILCDVTDPVSLYKGMIKVNDHDVVDGIVASASSMLSNYYSSEIISQKHIQLYESRVI